MITYDEYNEYDNEIYKIIVNDISNSFHSKFWYKYS